MGALAVAAGALGAHALRGAVDAHTLEVWNTAAKYHLVHAVVLLGLAAYARATERNVIVPFTVLLGGVCVFSGSLYALVLTGERWLGATTPLGGVALIVGWVVAGIVVGRRK